MALYAYKGLNPSGRSVSGVRDADSPKALRTLMRKEGVVVTDCSVSKGSKSVQKGSGQGLNRELSFGGIKKAEIGAFTRQLATLLRAGIPLAEALSAQFEQIDNVRLKQVVEELKSNVNEGSSFADALAKHPKAFDDLFVSMTRAGEISGNLDEVLERLADFLDAGQALKSKVQGAMLYPIIMIVVGSGIMGVLMVAVIPNITTLFEQQDKALPWNTELLIWFSHVIGAYWWLYLPALVGGFILFRRWSKSETGRPAWHGFNLRIPLFGALLRQVAVARFSRTLGTMLLSGVPMLKAIEVSKETLGNVVLMKVIDDAREAISQGESIATTLRRSGHFPAMMTHMIAVGERAGALEDMLFKVADTFDRETEAKLDRFTGVLEPMMLVLMGGAVGFVVFSILMPIMDMSSFAQ